MKLFRKLKLNDLPYFNENALPINKEEIKALTGLSIMDLFLNLDHVFEASEVWEIDGKPACIFGGVPENENKRIWLLSTPSIFDYKIQFLTWTYKRLRKEKKTFKMLHSNVYEKNHLTKKWLKKLGFTICDAEPMGINGELFHHFYMG